jgi:CHAD domain-containing protein
VSKTAASTNLERETKLEAPAGFRIPELGGDGLVATDEEPQRLVTVYVDTPDLRIVRWGSSLRHRQGEGREKVWTVKLPSSGNGSQLVRTEVNFEGADARKLPTAAADLVRAFVRGQELAPVARLQTVRRGVRISDDAGTPLAMVTDDEVSVMDGRRVASRFRELEVELDPAADAALSDVLVGRLREAGAGPVDNVSKVVRALGPRAAAPPDLEVPELDEHAGVTDVVRRELATSVVRLLRHDAGVRLGEDPEEVHQARVATRRVRSALRTFRDVLEPEWATSLRDRLRWLADALGDVRDTEVLRERIRSREPMLPEADLGALEELVTMLEAKRDEARERLLRAIREPEYLALLDDLVEAARQPRVLQEVATAPAATALRAVVERPWLHLSNAVERARDDGSDASMHGVRIRAKRARYAAEAVSPVFGKRAQSFAEAAASLQDVLGEHQDSVVARRWLREAAASGGDAFVAGELAAIEAQAAAAARAAWPKAWKTLSRKRLRFWA